MPYTPTKTKALAELSFNEERHRYSYGGILVPNVSTIIDEELNMYHGRPDAAEDARKRGTEVHAVTAWADEYALTGKGERYKSVPRLDYLEAWWKCLEDTGFKVEEVEQRVFHTKKLYAGTLDRVGDWDGQLTVLDIKTGMYYPISALQTAAYMEAANEGRVGRKITRRVVAQLQPDRNPPYTMHEHKERTDFQVFLSALLMYNWKGLHVR